MIKSDVCPQQCCCAKPNILGHIFYTSPRVSLFEDWYFYSGYPRHMILEKNYLKGIETYSNSCVTFDDNAKVKIIGKCKLYHHGIPCLNDVLLVDGLTTNLISISQFYDQDLYVKFYRVEWTVTNKIDDQLI